MNSCRFMRKKRKLKSQFLFPDHHWAHLPSALSMHQKLRIHVIYFPDVICHSMNASIMKSIFLGITALVSSHHESEIRRDSYLISGTQSPLQVHSYITCHFSWSSVTLSLNCFITGAGDSSQALEVHGIQGCLAGSMAYQLNQTTS